MEIKPEETVQEGFFKKLVNLVNNELKAVLIIVLAYGLYQRDKDYSAISERNYSNLKSLYDGVVADNVAYKEEIKGLYNENHELYKNPTEKMDTIIAQNDKIIKLKLNKK